MRLKEQPDDFAVEEVLGPIEPDPEGAFVLYRATKRGISQHEMQDRLARALGVPVAAVAVCGLKDKLAVAVSHVSVRAPDPAAAFASPPRVAGVDLVPLARIGRRVASTDIASNRFRVVVRDLKRRQVEALEQRCVRLLEDGLPSYFDDQRFGGESADRGFVAERLEDGRLAEGLELLLARPSPKDPKPARLVKEGLRPLWPALAGALAGEALPAAARQRLGALARAARGELAPVVRALAREPADGGSALRELDRRLRVLLYEHAQAQRWNLELSSFVAARFEPRERFQIMIRTGALLFWRALDPARRAALEGLELSFAPLPRAALALGVRAQEGLRRAWLRPLALAVEGVGEPDAPRAAGSPRLFDATLRLELPRGAYATLVLKRLFHMDGLSGPSGLRQDEPA